MENGKFMNNQEIEVKLEIENEFQMENIRDFFKEK